MRYIYRGIAICLIAYVAAVAALYVGQRILLFSTNDGGALAAADWMAIEGSQRLTLTTPDGVALAAWFVAPKPGKPVFLFLHGKGGGLQKKKWRWQRIRKAGAGVLALSYRGYPGSAGTPHQDGLTTDAHTAYTWLRNCFDPDRIVIHGLSLGTGVGVLLAAKVKAKALVLEAPFTAAVDVAAERYPWAPVHWLMSDQFRSRDAIDKIGMPVLIAHGTRDSVVPFHHGQRLFHRARQPKIFVPMEGGDHSTLVRDGLYRHIWSFLGIGG